MNKNHIECLCRGVREMQASYARPAIHEQG